MSAIQSSTGLITGIPIEDTVDQLIAVAGRRRDLVSSRNRDLEGERAAFDQVSTLLLGLQFSSRQLGQSSVYSATTVTSNNTQALSATRIAGASPTAGSYQITPLQLASAHSLAGTTIAEGETLPSTGSLSLRIGGQIDQTISLSEINSGVGFTPGSLRITDRDGETATIDLRTARSIDDVIEAINNAADIDVTASVDGDRIKLTDNSGGSGNFRVREVGTGTTAASLGLAGINVAADSAIGSDIYDLHAGTQLSRLNDGNGVLLRDSVDDIEVTLADGSVLSIDLGDSATIGEVVDAINAADNSKLTAAIASDGRRLELTDLTSGATTFAVTSVGTGTAAEDLGLTTVAVAGIVTGARLIGGLSDTLTSSLSGGQGLGTLGQVTLTDRNGGSDTIDLAGAETLREIIDTINSANTSITATINSQRDGITLTDTSGGGGNLTIASADANNTAESLGIAIDTATDSVDSGSLGRQTISQSTRLSSLNGGRGVQLGSIRVTDSSGLAVTVRLDTSGSEAETIGDVIDAINNVLPNVEARLNDTGDGIVLEDKAGGTGTLSVAEVSGRTTAADLHLLGASSATNGAGEQIIDGRNTLEVDLSTLSTGAGNIPLSGLRGGLGVSLGIFRITNATGVETIVNLGEAGNEAFTVADVIERINSASVASGASVTASISAAGTGIKLTDDSGGTGSFSVEDLGSGTSAAELGIAKTSSSTGATKTINGAALFSAAASSGTGIEALAQRINDSRLGINAQSLFDGTGYRLVLTAATPGGANQLLVRSSNAGLAFTQTSEGRDALAQLGGAGGIITSSTDNVFENIVSGVRFTARQATDAPISVTVSSDSQPAVNAAQSFVDAYNSLQTTLDGLTDFNADDLTTGILFGRSEVVRIESDLARILSGRISGAGSITSLESLGISLDTDGKLAFDSAKFRDVYATQPNDVERFFSAESTGVVARVNTLVDQLAGGTNSLISARSESLSRIIESNTQRIDFFNEQLDRQRARLLSEFYKLEETIALIQSNLSAVESITAFTPLTTRRD